MDVGPFLERNLAKDLPQRSRSHKVTSNQHCDFSSLTQAHLHSHDSVDEENEADENGDPGQSLERLDERPQERPDSFALAEQLHQTHHAEQTEEVDGNHVAAGLKCAKKCRLSPDSDQKVVCGQDQRTLEDTGISAGGRDGATGVGIGAEVEVVRISFFSHGTYMYTTVVKAY